MGWPDVCQLHPLAAQLDGHPVREGHLGHGGRPILADDRPLGVVVVTIVAVSEKTSPPLM
jgi:hypothetical protein